MNYYLYFCAILLLSLLIITTHVNAANAIDVCVIGAGPAGVQAAYALEEAGYTTVLIEKESYIGGQTKTINDESSFRYKMGAVIYFGRKGSSLDGLFNKFNIELQPLPSQRIFEKGETNSRALLPSRLILATFGTISYLTNRMIFSYFKGLDGPEGYISGYPSELNIPLRNWLLKRWIYGLNDFFWFFLTTYGYGHPNDMPALYGVKPLDWGMMLDFVFSTFIPSFSHARIIFYQDLLIAMGDMLQGDIYLSTTITEVIYGQDSNMIIFETDDGLQSQQQQQQIECSKIILTLAPTSSAMEVFTPSEIKESLIDLTSQVLTTNYYTMLVPDPKNSFSNSKDVFYLAEQKSIPDNPSVNLLYYKQYESSLSGIVVYYLTPSEKTIEQVQIEMLNSYNEFTGNTISVNEIQDFNAWDYFPHVSSESLDDDFFKKFHSLQGLSNQYYTGSLFTGGNVQDTMEHARYIVNEFF